MGEQAYPTDKPSLVYREHAPRKLRRFGCVTRAWSGGGKSRSQKENQTVIEIQSLSNNYFLLFFFVIIL